MKTQYIKMFVIMFENNSLNSFHFVSTKSETNLKTKMQDKGKCQFQVFQKYVFFCYNLVTQNVFLFLVLN